MPTIATRIVPTEQENPVPPLAKAWDVIDALTKRVAVLETKLAEAQACGTPAPAMTIGEQIAHESICFVSGGGTGTASIVLPEGQEVMIGLDPAGTCKLSIAVASLIDAAVKKAVDQILDAGVTGSSDTARLQGARNAIAAIRARQTKGGQP